MSVLEETFTIVKGKTEYKINNTLKTTNCICALYDANGDQIIVGINVKADFITIGIADSASTELSGQNFTLVVIS